MTKPIGKPIMDLLPLARRHAIRFAIALGAWAMAAVPAAQAAPISLDNPGASISLSGSGKNGSFLDVYFFSLSQTLGLSESVAYSSRNGHGLISNFRASLFSTNALTPLISGTDNAPGTNLTTNQLYVGALAAGMYRLEISGFGSGSRGGSYTGTLTAVTAAAPLLAVPEPESWAMMFAGLALMLFRVRQVTSKTSMPAISLNKDQHHAQHS